MGPANWWSIIFTLREEEEEIASIWLLDESSLGAHVETIGSGRCRIQAYFSGAAGPEPLRGALSRLEARLGRSLSAGEPVPVADGRWVESFQESLLPIDVGRRFRVHPGDPPPEISGSGGERIPLWIPPGRAFGTGDHPTTALCIEFLERSVRPRQHVLDVGTGSGILALAAVHLQAARVVAVEADREAAAVAAENFRRVGVGARVELVVGTTSGIASGWFDLIVANLTSGALIELMPDLAHLLRPGGGAFLSGILEHEADSVEDAASGRGLVGVCRRSRSGWSALEVSKPAGR